MRDFIGHVDSHKGGIVRGWACNLSAPETRVTVRALLNGLEVGAVIANEFRQDLAGLAIGDGSGCYMFRFTVPYRIRQLGEYELRFIAGGQGELAGSPLRIYEQPVDRYRLNYQAAAGPHLDLLSAHDPEGSQLPRNSGLAILNGENSQPGPRTLIVAGHARSGTSMAARALHVAGLPMGLPEIVLSNYEDKEFVEVLRTAIENPPLDTGRMEELIRRRDRNNGSWGFKAPDALESMPYLLHHTRNPHVVVVFRDMLATSVRERLAVDADLWESFESVLAYETLLLTFLRNTNVPCFLVSYEKALLDSRTFCRHLAEFAGLESDGSWIERAAEQINPNQRDYLEGVRDARRDLELPPSPIPVPGPESGLQSDVQLPARRTALGLANRLATGLVFLGSMTALFAGAVSKSAIFRGR